MPSRGLSATTLTLAWIALASACTGAIEGAHGPVTDPPPPAVPPQPPPGPPGPAPAPTPPPSPTACSPAPRRIWKLTPDQYSRAVATVLPGVADAGERIAASLADPGGFSNTAQALAMTAPHVTQLLKSGFDLGAGLAAAPEKLAPCLPAGARDATCIGTLVDSYAPRAFRRDLSADERTAIVAFVKKEIEAADLRTGLGQLFLYLFSSPHFLYRTELGADGATGPVTLTPFEKAAALSFFLTDGPPDDALLAAARAGKLASAADLETETRRLLADPGRAIGLRKFLAESFSTTSVRAARKDPMLFPAWTDALAQDLARESDAFVAEVVWKADGTLATLLSADFSVMNRTLAGFYGLSGQPAGTDFARVGFPAGQRAGLLTQAGFLAAKADDDDTAPVRRGLFLREHLLCEIVPEPPATVNAVPPQPDGMRTQRQRLAIHSAEASCATCHDRMDPLGLSFEHYDAIGRYRAMDVGQPIDAAGTLDLPSGKIAFRDAVELMRGLSRAPETATCFVATAFRYAHGRAPDPVGDRCAMDRLTAAFNKSGGQIVDLAVAITTDPSFVERQ